MVILGKLWPAILILIQIIGLVIWGTKNEMKTNNNTSKIKEVEDANREAYSKLSDKVDRQINEVNNSITLHERDVQKFKDEANARFSSVGTEVALLGQKVDTAIEISRETNGLIKSMFKEKI